MLLTLFCLGKNSITMLSLYVSCSFDVWFTFWHVIIFLKRKRSSLATRMVRIFRIKNPGLKGKVYIELLLLALSEKKAYLLRFTRFCLANDIEGS